MYPDKFDKKIVALGINDRVYAKVYYKHELRNDAGTIAVYLNAEEGRTYVSRDGLIELFDNLEVGTDFVVYEGKTCEVKTDTTGIYYRLRDVINCIGIKDVQWNGDYKEVYMLVP